MNDMKDNVIPFGMTAYEIIADAVKEYDYPVCFGFPAGHIKDNRTLIFGREVTLEITKESFQLTIVNKNYLFATAILFVMTVSPLVKV